MTISDCIEEHNRRVHKCHTKHPGRYYKTHKPGLIFPPPNGLSVKISHADYKPQGYNGLPLLSSRVKLREGDMVVLVPPGGAVYKCEFMEALDG